MILGIGCDIAQNDRFADWCNYSDEKLSHVFSDWEISALGMRETVQAKQEFLASRFAVKEAFYKALCSALPQLGYQAPRGYHGEPLISFAFVRKIVILKKNDAGVPYLEVNWPKIANKIEFDGGPGFHLENIRVHVSLSHERSCSMAFVLLEKN